MADTGCPCTMCKRGPQPSVILKYCDPGTLCHEECTETLCVHGSPKRVIATPEGMWNAVRAARTPPPKPKPIAIVKPMVREKKDLTQIGWGRGVTAIFNPQIGTGRGVTIDLPQSGRGRGVTAVFMHRCVYGNLKFTIYCTEILRKAYFVIQTILNSFKKHDCTFYLKMYTTYLRPILEYCSQVSPPPLKQNIDKVESVQRYFTRWLLHNDMSYLERCNLLKLDMLEERRIKADLVMYFKFMNNFTQSFVQMIYLGIMVLEEAIISSSLYIPPAPRSVSFIGSTG